MTKKVNNQSVNNETKVVCPVCGSEFAIGEHEHKVRNATVIGADSGLGTIVLPVSKRGEVLKAAGIDTSKYFSIELPTGGSQLMMMTADGTAVPATQDDPIVQQIISQGTVPNRSLFRRWVMSQVFHGLIYEYGGFTGWMKGHGYQYTWKMLTEELRVQAKLYGKDMENYWQRNRWFNGELAYVMADNYIKQLRKDAFERPRHKCKGVPYVTVDHTHYFVTDIDKKLIRPLQLLADTIHNAKNPLRLYDAVRDFVSAMPCRFDGCYDQCPAWKDAYKGMGAYATMQNLLRFHGCTFPKNNRFYQSGKSGLQMLDCAAEAYQGGEGWRLFGLMKQMLVENNFDIEAKMKEWADAKKAKHLKR